MSLFLAGEVFVKMGKNKKGQMGALGVLPTVAITFVVAAIVLALGLSILSDTKGEFTASSLEANATEAGMEGLAKISDKLPLIGTVVAAVIVIALIVGAFAFRKQ